MPRGDFEYRELLVAYTAPIYAACSAKNSLEKLQAL